MIKHHICSTLLYTVSYSVLSFNPKTLTVSLLINSSSYHLCFQFITTQSRKCHIRALQLHNVNIKKLQYKSNKQLNKFNPYPVTSIEHRSIHFKDIENNAMNANQSFIYLLFTIKKFLTGIKGQYSSKVLCQRKELRRIYSIYFKKCQQLSFTSFCAKLNPDTLK